MLYTGTAETTVKHRDTRRYKGDKLDHFCGAKCLQDRIVHLNYNHRPPADWMHSPYSLHQSMNGPNQESLDKHSGFHSFQLRCSDPLFFAIVPT